MWLSFTRNLAGKLDRKELSPPTPSGIGGETAHKKVFTGQITGATITIREKGIQ